MKISDILIVIVTIFSLIWLSLMMREEKIVARERREKAVSHPEVLKLVKKYPREVMIINQIAYDLFYLKAFQDEVGSADYGNGSSYCLKHLYGQDGENLVKSLGVRMKDDEHWTAENCNARYRIVNDLKNVSVTN